MKIGIGVTTRNRAAVLENCLDHIRAYKPYSDKDNECRIVIVDDGSSPSCEPLVKRYGFDYIYHPERKGIAAAKNACLKHLEDCDYIFLFDDDCWPTKDGWYAIYIGASATSGIQHFNFLSHRHHGLAREKKVDNLYTGQTYHIQTMGILGGPLLFLTKEVINKVGAFNPNYKVYGWEHVGYTVRIHRAGLTKGYGMFLHVREAEEYIYSSDYMGRPGHESSIAGEHRQGFVNENLPAYEQDQTGDIYIPLT